MLVYDWLWWGQLTNQNPVRRCAKVRRGVCGGARRCVEVHRGVHGGAQRCMEGCTEVCGGVHRGAQRCAEVVGKKNQDFMLIRF